MLIGVKRCVEQNDLRGLHYIFAEALEADPTFEKYQEDYEYCKKLPGFLEAYEELRPLKNDSSEWDETYWTQLKLDQKKNFSEKRMEHMKRVALVVRKEKIERLQAERTKKAETIVSEKSRKMQPQQKTVMDTPTPGLASPSNQSNTTIEVLPNPEEEAENQRIAEVKKQIQEARKAHLANEKKEKAQWTQDGYDSENQEDKGGKKAKGIALIIVILLVAIVVALFLLKGNPR